MGDNRIFLLESDPDAVARENRRMQIMIFIVIAFFLTLGCLIWRTKSLEDLQVPLLLLVGIWLVGVLLSAFVCFRIDTFKKNEVWIGTDFLAGQATPTSPGLNVVKYEDIVRVTLDIRHNHITGVTVHAGFMKLILARWVRDPAILVCEIFEHVSPQVKWRRSGRSFACLSRDEVRIMIEKADPPDITRILPPGTRYARADEMFPAGPGREVEAVTLRRQTRDN